MSRYIITGGKPLSGEVSIRGAKNAGFKQIIASMLSGQPTQLYNVPQISDVRITLSIAKKLGAQITKTGEHTLEISTPEITSHQVPHGTGQKSRSSFMFSAPLLARTGKAIFPLPGGDRLGARPLDRLFDCLKLMNVNVSIDGDTITLETTGIKPANYIFPKPSHTVTEVAIMIAALANGRTTLENTALEPEIDDLIDMLNSMGAQIYRDVSNPKTIIIDGVPWLHGTNHQVISDRNEAVTFACAALSTKGSVSILRLDPKLIKSFLETLEKMGAKVSGGRDEVDIAWTQPLRPVDIETNPEPGFMTDWQAVFTVLLTQAVGCSSIVERVWPARFQHVPQLEQMGAKFKFFNPDVTDPTSYYYFNPESDKPSYFHGVKIYGPVRLKPIQLKVDDLRGGACATLAALTASGESTIDGVEYIERGYERLCERLCYLGADIKYIKT